MKKAAARLASICVLWVVLCAAAAFSLAGTASARGSAHAETGGESRPVLILMYHQFLKSRKSDYIVTPETLQSDLRALKRHGYRSVRAAELAAYGAGEGGLPDKPVLVTFDDGHYNNLYYAEEILRAEGFTAVESVIGRFSKNSTDTESGGNPNYSHLTWDEIRTMRDTGVFEIGNHTYDMHNYTPRFGAGRRPGETDAQYRAALEKDAGKLQAILKEKSGVTPIVFAYPFGKYDKLSDRILTGMGFRVTLTCNEHVSTVKKGDPDSLLSLGRYNRNPRIDMDAFLTRQDALYKKGE